MQLGRSRKPGGKETNGTYQLHAYADDVDLLGDNIDTIKKNTETLISASKEVGLEVNAYKTNISICCYLVTRMQGKIRTQRKVMDPLKLWRN
jgi:hypothetical protein